MPAALAASSARPASLAPSAVDHQGSMSPVRTPSNRFFRPGASMALWPRSSRSWSSVRPPDRATAMASASPATAASSIRLLASLAEPALAAVS